MIAGRADLQHPEIDIRSAVFCVAGFHPPKAFGGIGGLGGDILRGFLYRGAACFSVHSNCTDHRLDLSFW
ncbi:hypothetical protein NI18_19785 [Sphingomonas sp. Ant20]|nr:hypothetical protein NI18_19785 [Sphingomonas sp. Ant20]